MPEFRMLVAQPGGVAFRHELARVAVAGTIDPRRTTSLHRLALDTLRADDADVARLAHHAEAAGDAAAVEDFGMAAVEAALRVGAHREAAAQFGRVLRAGALGPQRRAEVLQRCGHENYLIDHFEDAVGHTAEAADLHRSSGDLDALGRTLVALAGVQLCVGQHEDAEISALEAVRLMRQSEPGGGREIAGAYATLAAITKDGGDLTGGLGLARRALAIAEESGQSGVVVHAATTAGTIALLGDDDRGLELVDHALTVGHAAGVDEQVGRVYLCVLDVAQRNRRWDLVDRYLGPGIEFCRERGLGLWERYLHIFHARTLLDRGRWSDATRAIPDNVDRSSSPLPRITALTIVGLVRARRGDPGQWAALDEAGELAFDSGELQWTAPVTAARAEAMWLSGRSSGIDTEALGTQLTACVAGGFSWWSGELAWWRRVAGIVEDSPASLPEPWDRQLAGRADAAAASWRKVGCPYEEALAPRRRSWRATSGLVGCAAFRAAHADRRARTRQA